jgi:hypothetical protein
VGPRDVLDAVVKRKIPSPPRESNSYKVDSMSIPEHLFKLDILMTGIGTIYLIT